MEIDTLRNRRRGSTIALLGLLIILTFQAGCFWKLWGKKKPVEEITFDVYGTVETVDQTKLVIQSKKGRLEFVLVDSSIKGSNFETGAYVHVYYKVKGEAKEVTMVVEKIS